MLKVATSLLTTCSDRVITEPTVSFGVVLLITATAFGQGNG